MCLLHTQWHVECIQTEMVQFLLSNEAALLVSLCWLGSKTQKIEQFHQGGNIGCASTDSNGFLQELLSVAHHPLGGGSTFHIVVKKTIKTSHFCNNTMYYNHTAGHLQSSKKSFIEQHVCIDKNNFLNVLFVVLWRDCLLFLIPGPPSLLCTDERDFQFWTQSCLEPFQKN